MKVVIDRDKCTGHARCEALSGKVYATDEIEGKAVLIHEPLPDLLAQEALRGARACPERAIAVFERDGDARRIWPPEA